MLKSYFKNNNHKRKLFLFLQLKSYLMSLFLLDLVNPFFDEFETETVYSEEEHYGYDIAAWIKGDSMEPVYLDGEVALIRASCFDYDGAVYALSWNDSVYIKKLYREENGFRMVSLNDDYPDKWIPYEDNPRIVGLVVSHFMPVVGA